MSLWAQDTYEMIGNYLTKSAVFKVLHGETTIYETIYDIKNSLGWQSGLALLVVTIALVLTVRGLWG